MDYQNMYGQLYPNPYYQNNYRNNGNYGNYGNSYNNYGNYEGFNNNGNYNGFDVRNQNQQVPQMNSGFQWVQGEAAAKAFHVDAGQTVLLMDSDSPVLYFKSSDPSGRPIPMVIYDLVERKSQQPNSNPGVDMTDYIKRDELEAIINDVVNNSVMKKMDELNKSNKITDVIPASSIKSK